MNPFRIGVLGNPKGWYVQDLIRASTELAANEGIEIDLRAFAFESLVAQTRDRCSVSAKPIDSEWEQKQSSVSAQDLGALHTLIVRTMPLGSLEQIVFRMNALHLAEYSGAHIVNSPRCLEICIDKWLTIQKARAAGLLTPATVCCQSREEALEAWHALGEDCVVKPIFGGEGRGIVRVCDRDMAWRVFSTLEQLRSAIYIQEFIPCDGCDLRLLVMDDELYCVRRSGGMNWKANVSQGGMAEPIEPTFEQAAMAFRAAKIVGGWIVGVDLIESRDGRNMLIEVNAVPGWRATGKALGIDLAKNLLCKLTARSIPQD